MDELQLDPATDPRTQAVASGARTTEYLLSRNALILTGLMVLGAFVLVGLGRLEIEGLLVVLGIALGGGLGVGTVARGYTADRTSLKTAVSKGAVAVAVAEATGQPPAAEGTTVTTTTTGPAVVP